MLVFLCSPVSMKDLVFPSSKPWHPAALLLHLTSLSFGKLSRMQDFFSLSAMPCNSPRESWPSFLILNLPAGYENADYQEHSHLPGAIVRPQFGQPTHQFCKLTLAPLAHD